MMRGTTLKTWPMIHGGFIAKFEGFNLPYQATFHGVGATREEAQKDLFRQIPREILLSGPVMPFNIENVYITYPI